MNQVLFVVNWPWHEHRDHRPRANRPARAKRWVKAKIEFGGVAWARLAAHADGAAALVAWDAVRALAQLSPWRGLLLSDDARSEPLSIELIAAVTHWPHELLRRGLAVLIEELQWVAWAEWEGDAAGLSERLWGAAFPHDGALLARANRAPDAPAARKPRAKSAPTSPSPSPLKHINHPHDDRDVHRPETANGGEIETLPGDGDGETGEGETAPGAEASHDWMERALGLLRGNGRVRPTPRLVRLMAKRRRLEVVRACWDIGHMRAKARDPCALLFTRLSDPPKFRPSDRSRLPARRLLEECGVDVE